MAALGVYEYHRYFQVFAKAEITQAAFNQNYYEIALEINALPAATKKYVIIDAGGVEAYGLPVPARLIPAPVASPGRGLPGARRNADAPVCRSGGRLGVGALRKVPVERRPHAGGLIVR